MSPIGCISLGYAGPQDIINCMVQVILSATPCCLQPMEETRQKLEHCRRAQGRLPASCLPHRGLAEAVLLYQSPQVLSRGLLTQSLALLGLLLLLRLVLHHSLLIPRPKVLEIVPSLNHLQLCEHIIPFFLVTCLIYPITDSVLFLISIF